MSQELRQNADTLLASTSVDMKTAGVTSIYTVPQGFTLYVHNVVVRDPTNSLAGGTDYDFGDTTNSNYFKQTVDLSSMTDTENYYIISADDAVAKHINAGESFDIEVITGSTASATANIDLFGYLV